MNAEPEQTPAIKKRQVMRALPSGMEVGFAALAILALTSGSPLLLAGVFVIAVYGLLVASSLDPECGSAEHQHEDCPACCDLPPLISVNVLLRRVRKGQSR
jgi:hypothetical protein